jgi:hypothetical protein
VSEHCDAFPDNTPLRMAFAQMLDAVRSMLEPVRWLANSTFTPAWLQGGQRR